jgi:plastocyanin
MNGLRITALSALVLVLVTSCSGGGSAASISPPADADVVVTAENMAFDTGTITLNAGEGTTIFFRNLDGQPHNVAIYADDTATEALWVGETITDDAITETIPALDAGEYFFRCDVHPDMSGTVVVEG